MGEQLSEANRALIERSLDPVDVRVVLGLYSDHVINLLMNAARSEGPHPESGEWVMVPCQPSYKLVSDLATEWGYSIEEASESYQGFLDVVSRHGAAGSDPEAYEADRLADEEGEV